MYTWSAGIAAAFELLRSLPILKDTIRLEHYYSFSDGFRWRVFARRAALKTAATSRWLLGFLNRAFQIQVVLLMHSFGFEPSMRILDVGSGSGSLIRDLRSAGFKYAMGVDRFVASDIQENGGLIVKRGTLSEVEGNWDRIILNHSLEHMPDHLGVLSELRAKLSRNGQLIIRIPLVSFAWQKYGTHWVQLDAPRHLCVHSERSFGLAARKAGLRIKKQYDMIHGVTNSGEANSVAGTFP